VEFPSQPAGQQAANRSFTGTGYSDEDCHHRVTTVRAKPVRGFLLRIASYEVRGA